MKKGKQVRTTTRAERRNDAEKDIDDDVDVDKEDFVVKLNNIVASNRRKGTSDFQVKKNAIFKRAREHNGQISREMLASMHDAREMVEEILAGGGQDHGMGDLSSMFSRRDDTVDHIIKEFGVLPTEVSPVRSRVINTASSTLQEQQDFYEESRRKIVRGAQAYAESIIERQQIATDASELIRHYNALLRTTTPR